MIRSHKTLLEVVPKKYQPYAKKNGLNDLLWELHKRGEYKALEAIDRWAKDWTQDVRNVLSSAVHESVG